MANPFTSISDQKNNLKLNVWDWSHEFHFTTEIGRLLPCFCARLGAKQSLSISATHAEQFMPMMFPVQNRMRSRISFFKIPIRALWKDYMDYISSVNQVDSNGNPIMSKFEEPYFSISSSGELAEKFDRFFGTCSNLDNLGLPTTFDDVANNRPTSSCYRNLNSSSLSVGNIPTISLSCITTDSNIDDNSYYVVRLTNFGAGFIISSASDSATKLRVSFPIPTGLNSSNYEGSCILFPSVGGRENMNKVIALFLASAFVDATTLEFTCIDVMGGDTYKLDMLDYFSLAVRGDVLKGLISTNANFLTAEPPLLDLPYGPLTCPWYNQTTKEGLKISSYPLRAFEAVYNAYFRYNRNNPLSVGGVKKYNDWVLCRDKGGDDSINYAALQIDGEESPLEYFFGRKYCNWEPDMFTTCVQSPQDGRSPLVGLTNYATTYSENGINTTRLSSVLVDEDGQHYNVSFTSDENGLTGASYEAVSSDEITGKVISTRYDAVTQGISIEDFRQVNAYQRYLELNMRRGYSYKDIIEGRFDVKVRYDELLMPEFCGGFTRDVDVSPVTQTTPTDESGSYQGALGSQAGQAFVRGKNKGNINIFCDEDSIILGILVVWPDPVYTQYLPKHFLYRNPLDLFNPEFANIGFQPLLYQEVAPIQTWNNNKSLMNSTFGYQRPWYEMLSRVNEAHGLYRTQLRNFLMNRRFSGIPQLSKEFLLVKPEQVNDVFSVTETTDKIFGMIRYEMYCKNAVPRNSNPRLE